MSILVYSCFQEILPCILDFLDVPKIMEVEGAIDEVHFTRLLHRCDAWIFLLAIPGIVIHYLISSLLIIYTSLLLTKHLFSLIY